MKTTNQDVRTAKLQAEDLLDGAFAAEWAAEKATASGNAREAVKQTDLAGAYRRLSAEYTAKAIDLEAKLEAQRVVARKNARARRAVYSDLGMSRGRYGSWE